MQISRQERVFRRGLLMSYPYNAEFIQKSQTIKSRDKRKIDVSLVMVFKRYGYKPRKLLDSMILPSANTKAAWRKFRFFA
jgi:hypothetical protein